MINRILAISKKETREILRDKRSLLIIFVLPVFLLIMFGYAVTLDIDEIKLGVLDNDRSPLSREFISTINSSAYFTIVSEIENDGEMFRIEFLDGSWECINIVNGENIALSELAR